jgi:hypothetical protein
MNGKISAVLKLILALFLCGLISLGIYLLAMPFIYGVWHCPPPRECSAPAWAEYSVFFILLSPFLVFAGGAYFCRGIVAQLTKIKFLRVILLLGFAFFPLFITVLLAVYIINTPLK